MDVKLVVKGCDKHYDFITKIGYNCMIPAKRVTPESIDYLLKNYPITSGVPFENLQSKIK